MQNRRLAFLLGHDESNANATNSTTKSAEFQNTVLSSTASSGITKDNSNQTPNLSNEKIPALQTSVYDSAEVVANVLGKRNYPCQIPPSFKSSSVSNLRKKSIQTETSTNKNTRPIPLQSPIGGYSGLHKLYSCTG